LNFVDNSAVKLDNSSNNSLSLSCSFETSVRKASKLLHVSSKDSLASKRSLKFANESFENLERQSQMSFTALLISFTSSAKMYSFL